MRKLILLPVLMSAVLTLTACGQAAEPASAPEKTGPVAADPSVTMPEDAPPQEEAMAPETVPTGTAAPGQTASGEAASCQSEIGSARAVRLAERCTMVSPASHPPCNPANPCELVQGEIDRSCAMYGAGETKPAECAA